MVSEKIEIKLLCYTLGVSRSGFYSWLNRSVSNREIENEVLKKEILKIHDESRKNYGLPRIQEKLKKIRKKLSKNRIYALMKKINISGLIHKNLE